MGVVFGSPTASALTVRAAVRYCSSSDGDTRSTSAMLSNPFASSSAGSSEVASMSSARTSRTAAAYSDRLRRWSGDRPGFGDAAATRSIDVSSDAANASMVASSGRGMPCGGIMRPWSLRTTFSQTSAWSATRARSTASLSSTRPPVFSRALWQLTQYLSTSARSASADSVASGFSRTLRSGVDCPCTEVDAAVARSATPMMTAQVNCSLTFTRLWRILARLNGCKFDSSAREIHP